MTRKKVLLVSNDHVGRRMVGPAIRYYEFAAGLASRFDVTLVVPFATDIEHQPFRIVVVGPDDDHGLTRLCLGADVVVAERLPVPTMAALAGSETPVVYDLYAPRTLESLALDARAGDRGERSRLLFRATTLVQEVALLTGDAFICATERQRDLWLGALVGLGRLRRHDYLADPSLRRLVEVVPFGIPVADPPSRPRALRGVVDGIGERDRVLVWPGGIWEWFDPLTVIRAVATLRESHPDLRLVFMGLGHPNPHIERMAMMTRAVALADELALRDSVVFFNFGWVPYDDRGAFLRECDVAVSAHFDDVETRFALRTRLLDCVWAGLPVVTTRGDAVGDLLAERGVARVVAAESVDGWRTALTGLLDDTEARTAAAARGRPPTPRPRLASGRRSAGGGHRERGEATAS